MVTLKGVYVPATIIGEPGFMATVFSRHERLHRFLVDDLRALGALPEPVAPDPAHPGDEQPIRITNRAVAEYMMRVVDGLIGITGDPVSALLLMQMTRLNTEHIADADLGGWAADPLTLQPCALASPRRCASRPRLHGATPSRSRPWACARREAGLLATAAAESHPALAHMADENLTSVQRLFARLRHLGALVPLGRIAGRDPRRPARLTRVRSPSAPASPCIAAHAGATPHLSPARASAARTRGDGHAQGPAIMAGPAAAMLATSANATLLTNGDFEAATSGRGPFRLGWDYGCRGHRRADGRTEPLVTDGAAYTACCTVGLPAASDNRFATFGAATVRTPAACWARASPPSPAGATPSASTSRPSRRRYPGHAPAPRRPGRTATSPTRTTRPSACPTWTGPSSPTRSASSPPAWQDPARLRTPTR